MIWLRNFMCLGVLTSLFVTVVSIESDGIINIDVANWNETNNVFKIREILHGPTKIHIKNVYNFGFFIIQVHSFSNTVYLSPSNTSEDDNIGVNGTNIGLVQMITTDEFDFYLNGIDHTHVLIVVTGYDIKAPIPGGCNLTFETEDAPYQKLHSSQDLITLDAQPPGVFPLACESVNITIDFYHLFLEEQDFTSESYFLGIEKMLTPENMIKYGRKIPKVTGVAPMRRYFVNYLGVGAVYGIVTDFHGFKSAYVPAVSYGCDIKDDNGCTGPTTTLWRVICGFMAFYGCFLCFMGHRFFQFNLFCTGFIVSAILTYIVISYSNLTEWETMVTLGIVGIIYGGAWLLIWWKLKIPILSVTLTYFIAGFLIGGVFYYSGPADLSLFRSDTNFWSVLIGISLLITILLLIISHWPSNIIATSFIGAYIFIIPFDLYFGGTLRYVILNVIHRATIQHFKWAVVNPPYQSTDVTFMISILLMAFLGMYIQWRHIKGRAPFPPSTNILDRGNFGRVFVERNGRNYNQTENTPLLRNIERNVYG
ncbi:transmembrane 7 superfamily member 3-like [Onthophagus taurus]|uniref:transmembrane 7 superfamily member 3-like n=1 Tax=Onthophagus taurus TaxID=166361 RepID=UPI000C202D3C|nr:transmembrane 7 superfamily member 3-like [Onthophagus taurus]